MSTAAQLAAAKQHKVEIKNRWTGQVLFSFEPTDEQQANGLAMLHALEAAARSDADLSDAYLSGADLSGAYLSEFKADFFDILLRATPEISGLRAALVAGRVDGSTYEGECACLVGTIANVRGEQSERTSYANLGNGIKPDSSRPAERWFMGIRKGDTPETSQISAITVEWLDEFVGLLNIARAAA